MKKLILILTAFFAVSVYAASGSVDLGPTFNTGGAGTGTVTSVGLSLPAIFTISGSPVTTAGTLTGTLATQSANTVFAGPASGGAATPTFRALVAADVPSLNYISSLTGDVTATGPGAAAATVVTVGGATAANIASATATVLAASATDLTGNTLVLRASGTTAVGALGIGISSPAFPLDIVSNTSAATQVVQQTGYGANSIGWRGRHARGTSASPTALLTGDILSFFSGRGYGDTAFAATSTAAINAVAAATFTDASMPTYLQFMVTPTGSVTAAEKMRIDTTGFVGIGVTSPQDLLHADGGATAGSIRVTNTTSGSTSADGIQLGIASNNSSVWLWNFENTPLRFATNNAEKMRLDATGNLGIGTTNPTALLSVGTSSAFKVDASGSITGSPVAMASTGIVTVTSAASPYTILTTDSLILVDTTGGAVQLNLPNPTLRRKIKIKDSTGNFGTNQVTIHRFGSEKIENVAADDVLWANFGNYEFQADGTNYFKVSAASNRAVATFAASGTFLTPLGVTQYIVCGRGGSGGGAGGGGGGGGSTTTAARGGGGGASGGSVVTRCTTATATPNTSLTITIGAAGALGAGGAGATANAAGAAGSPGTGGGNGGATTFSTILTFRGGIAGGAGVAGALATTGTAGSAATATEISNVAAGAGGVANAAGAGSVSATNSLYGGRSNGGSGGASGGAAGGGGGAGGSISGGDVTCAVSGSDGGAGGTAADGSGGVAGTAQTGAGCGGSGGGGGGAGGIVAVTGSNGGAGGSGVAGVAGSMTITWSE